MFPNATNRIDLAWRVVAAHVYLLRARFASRLTMGFRIIALGIVAGAFFLLVEGDVIIGLVVLLLGGVVTWLAGLWVVPWGVDAYSRKLSHIMRDWLVDLRQEESRGFERARVIMAEVVDLDPQQTYADQTGAIQDSLRRCIRRIQRLKPPAILAADHRKHLEALAAYCAALQSYQDAIQGADVDAAEKAARRLSETRSTFNTVSQELSAKLRSTWTSPTKLLVSPTDKTDGRLRLQ